MGDDFGAAGDGIGDDVATEPPVLHPAIPKASSTSPAANGVRIPLKVKRSHHTFGYGYGRSQPWDPAIRAQMVVKTRQAGSANAPALLP